ncbi:MAG: hypothetical protein ACYTFI_08310, partial [Planctomycetota bacterium]
MELFFCEKCGNRVTDVEARQGKGKIVGELAWCGECMVYAEDAPARPAPSAAAVSRRRSKRRTSSARAPGPGEPAGGRARPSDRLSPPEDADVPVREPRNVLIAAIGGGIAVGLLIGLIVFYSMKSPETPVADPDAEGQAAVAPGTEPGRVASPEPAAAPAPERPAEPGTSTGPAASPPRAPKQPSRPAEPFFVNIWQPQAGKVFRTGSDVTIQV